MLLMSTKDDTLITEVEAGAEVESVTETIGIEGSAGTIITAENIAAGRLCRTDWGVNDPGHTRLTKIGIVINGKGSGADRLAIAARVIGTADATGQTAPSKDAEPFFSIGYFRLSSSA